MIGTRLITEDVVQELRMLACYEPGNLEQGIKLTSDSSDAMRAAAQRLHELGFISEADGGYLTPFGANMVEHLQHLLTALSSR